METIGEIIPFAKEMLNRRPSRGMLKIYMFGSTMVALGVIGGLVEIVLLPFVGQETVEDASAEQMEEENKEKEQVLVRPGVVDVLETAAMETKAKHRATAQQRDIHRLHAS